MSKGGAYVGTDKERDGVLRAYCRSEMKRETGYGRGKRTLLGAYPMCAVLPREFRRVKSRRSEPPCPSYLSVRGRR